jgi:hypothetical protein
MKQIVLLAVAIAGVASANPLCLSDTMANYQANYATLATACQVGDKLFYAFNYSSTANNATAPTNAQVLVNGDPSNPNEPGLIFSSAGWTVSGVTSNQTTFIDSNIRFTVTTIGLAPIIIDASLDFANQFSVSGAGQAQIGETVTPQGQAGVALAVDSNAGPFTSVAGFTGVNTVSVSKDLVVRIPRSTTTGIPSSATISSFREGFSEVSAPEPTSFLLLVPGLAGLAFLRRRR